MTKQNDGTMENSVTEMQVVETRRNSTRQARHLASLCVVGMMVLGLLGCEDGGDNDDSAHTTVVCELQVDPGNGYGFQSQGDGGNALESLGEMTESGNTLNIVAQGNAEIRGTLVGIPGAQQKFLAGSYIKWNSAPSAGQDLTGTFRFVLDSGTYTGTIHVSGSGVFSGSPYHIFDSNAVFEIGRQ